MAVTVIVKFAVDPAKFEAVARERASDFEAVAAEAKTVGGLHHRFVVGDGEMLAIDEWESVEAFQQFFATQAIIPTLMEAAGVQGPPEISIYQSLSTADAF